MRKENRYCRLDVGPAGTFADTEEFADGMGAATPEVDEPRPSFCNVLASSFPLGFNPLVSWNLFMASTVASSHLPLGVALYEPSLASAC